jgi:hypothetical protein
MRTSRRWLTIVATLVGLTACQVPVAPHLPPPIEARIDVPASWQAKAAIDDRIDEIKAGGTVSLIDPKVLSDPLDDVVVATGSAQAAVPHFSLTFGAAINPGYYLLEAYKFRPSGAAPLTVRTTMKFDGSTWRSVTPPDGSGRMTLNALSTALSALPYYDATVFPAQVIEVLAADGSLPAVFPTIGGFDRATVARMADGVQTSLVSGTDPTGGMVMLDRLNLNVVPGATPVPYEVTPGVTALEVIGAGLDTTSATANRVLIGPDGTPAVTSGQWLPSAVTAGVMGGKRQQLTVPVPASLPAGLYGLGLTRGGTQSDRLPIRAQAPQQLKTAISGSSGAMAVSGSTYYLAFVGDAADPGIHVAELSFNSGTGSYSLLNEAVIDATANATHAAIAVAGGNIEVLATFAGTTLKNYTRPVAGTVWSTATLVGAGVQVMQPILKVAADGTLFGGWLDGFVAKATAWPNPAANVVSLGMTDAVLWDFVPGNPLHVVWVDLTTKELRYLPYTIGTGPGATTVLSNTAQNQFVASVSVGLNASGQVGVAYTADIGGVGAPGRAFYGIVDGSSPMTADPIYEAPLAASSRINLGFRTDGRPVVVWAEGNIHYLLHVAIRNANGGAYGSGNWSDPLSLSNGEPAWSSLLLANARHHLMWMDEHGKQLYYLPLVWK